MKKLFYLILFISLCLLGSGPLSSGPITGSGSATSVGTLATQDADAVDIDGGTIDGATIGGTTPAPGSFTNLTVTGEANVTGVTWTGFAGDTTGNAATSTTATTANALATNATGTNLSLGGVANVTILAANVIKTGTSADATLSGTPIIITVYDAASNTPYYFKAYPTK